MEKFIEKARVLVEALPYIKNFNGSMMVVKYGGNAMEDEAIKQQVMLDFILMKLVGIRLIVVHGGGPHITSMMQRLGKEAVFIQGHRHTDQETMEITEMVLSGAVNKEIVSHINRNGGKAVGLSGKDAGMLLAHKKKDQSGLGVDYGLVGEIEEVNTDLLITLTQSGYIPVVSPVAMGEDGLTYNINADTAAAAIAKALKARRLLYMTDIRGIYEDIQDESSFLESINEKKAEQMKKTGKISKGMLPKIDASLAALKAGVEKVHIIDGRVEHSLLLELFTEAGVGTEIVL